jgi:hypothetical protein
MTLLARLNQVKVTSKKSIILNLKLVSLTAVLAINHSEKKTRRRIRPERTRMPQIFRFLHQVYCTTALDYPFLLSLVLQDVLYTRKSSLIRRKLLHFFLCFYQFPLQDLPMHITSNSYLALKWSRSDIKTVGVIESVIGPCR